jgi:hypothetical protein
MLRTLRHQKLKGLRSASRRRRNPDAPYGVMPATWRGALSESKAEARSLLSGTRQMLGTAGLPAEALPEPFDLNKRADDIATILASSQYPDLAAQSKLDTSSTTVAEQVFSVFEKVAAEKAAKPILAKAKRAFAARLDTLRASALAKRKAAGAQVRDATAEAEAEKYLRLEKELASLEGGDASGDTSTEESEPDEGEEDADTTKEEIKELYRQAKAARKRAGKKTPEVVLALIEAVDGQDPDEIMDAVMAVREFQQEAEAEKAKKAQKAKAQKEQKGPEVTEKRVPRSAGGKKVRRGGEAPSPLPVVQEDADEDDDDEDDDEEEEEDKDKILTISRAGERLAGYADYRARTRRTTKNDPSYLEPSAAVRRETAGDILLYVLNDRGEGRETQVFINNSLTETFAVKGRGAASWKKATQYVKWWREKPSEKTGQPIKARLEKRVVVATEAEPDKFEVALPGIRGATAAAPKRQESLATIMEQLRAEPKSRSNPRSCREGYLRNPLGRQVVADVREVFRRSNPGGLVTALVGAAGFVAGTYAEAEFGLSKQFTRGGKATVMGAREAARAAQERRLPALPKLPGKPKVKTTSDFKPSAKLEKMLSSFYALEGQKKRTPFSQAKKREEMEDRLDEMWGQIKDLEAVEMATQGIRSNPRKLAVPEHIAKTPRKAGERISAIGVKGKWPIGDLFHARLAAIYIMSPSHRAKKAQVLRALETNWPQYDWREFLARPVETGVRRAVANPSDYETARQMFDLRDMKKYGLITTGEYSDGLRYIEEGRGEEYLSYLRKRIAG